MDITDSKGFWRVCDGEIWNRKTGQLRLIPNLPSAHTLGTMHEKTFIRKCGQAFESGRWPD